MMLGLLLILMLTIMFVLSVAALKSVESEAKLASQRVRIEVRRQR